VLSIYCWLYPLLGQLGALYCRWEAPCQHLSHGILGRCDLSNGGDLRDLDYLRLADSLRHQPKRRDPPSGATPRTGEVKIRTTAVYTGTPIMTTLSGAIAAALGIAALRETGYGVKTLQEYH
jgi:hypothetical protein